MQLRCPNDNHLITVPDKLIGQRIKCPHCDTWMTVEAPPSSQIQTGMPNLSLDGANKPPKETVNLEHQIYDGMPPLSVMMALRRQQGAAFDADDFAECFPMTDDDWKALSAFESVLYSVMALRTTVVLGALAILINLIVCGASIFQGKTLGDPLIQLISLFVIAGQIVLIYVGCKALERVRLNALATSLPWIAFGVTLVVLFNAFLELGALGDRVTPALALLVAIPINLLAAFDSGRSVLRVGNSLEQVSPPEISHRLAEALKYLE
jgi:hypothetical protein